MAKKKLVLVDGHAIIHRAYHALPVLSNRSGQQVNAVYGFLSMLLKVVDELKPTHLAVAFDLTTPTFRHQEYIAYQSHRPETDQELQDQVKLVMETVESAEIPVYTAEGYEADDVIGTLAKQAAKKRMNVIVVTGDRDMLQLVNDKVKVYAPIKGLSEARLFGKKEVEDYLGVSPKQVVDFKGLTGDASDNYPGVPGVGPKTASALLKGFGSLDNLYATLKSKITLKESRSCQKSKLLSEKLVEKLVDGRESAILSQKLARIVTDAPVKLNLEKMKFEDFKDNEKFLNKLQEFNFKSLIKRVGGKEGEKKKNGSDQKGLFDR